MWAEAKLIRLVEDGDRLNYESWEEKKNNLPIFSSINRYYCCLFHGACPTE